MQILRVLPFSILAALLPILDRWLFPTVNGQNNFANVLATTILIVSPLIAVIGPLYFIEKKLLTDKAKWPVLLFPVWAILLATQFMSPHLDTTHRDNIIWVLLWPILMLATCPPSPLLLIVFYVALSSLLSTLYLALINLEFISKVKYYSSLLLFLCLNILFISTSWVIMFFE